LYGDGERAAINLALERKFLLLIDDWRPYEVAQASGIEVNFVNRNGLRRSGLSKSNKDPELYSLATNAVRE
jgi:predicted nucleic acid-binding protein